MTQAWKPNTYPFVTSPTNYELEKKYSKGELLEDLEYLQNTLEEVHPNLYFSKSSDFSYEQLTAIKTDIHGKLTRLEFYSRIAPYVADFRDGHTSVRVPAEEYANSDAIGNIRFPFNVTCKNGLVTLTSTVLEQFKEYVGRKLLSINGKPINQILERMTSMMSGESIHFKYSYLFMLFPKLLFALGCSSRNYLLKVSGDPSPEELTVPGISKAQSKMDSKSKTINVTKPYTYEIHKEFDCAVLTLLSCESEEKSREFCQDFFNILKKEIIGNLIVDLRRNGGGHDSIGNELSAYLTNKPVSQFSGVEMKISVKYKKYLAGHYRDSAGFPMKFIPISILTLLHPVLRMKTGSTYKLSLPEVAPPNRNPRFEGKVFVVISQCTYSSAASLAAMIKTYGLGKLIGEPTGGYVSTYGDSFMFSLPNTKLLCSVSPKFIIGPDGLKKPEPTYPDYSTSDLDIDNLVGPDAIPKIIRNLDKLE